MHQERLGSSPLKSVKLPTRRKTQGPVQAGSTLPTSPRLRTSWGEARPQELAPCRARRVVRCRAGARADTPVPPAVGKESAAARKDGQAPRKACCPPCAHPYYWAGFLIRGCDC